MAEKYGWSSGPGVETTPTTCGGCHCECGCLAYVKEGKVVYLEGDPNHPQNEGAFCPKGFSFVEYQNHPDRVTRPLKRIGERGEGRWEAVSWEQAISEIAEKLKKLVGRHGPTSVAWGVGDGDRDNNLCNLGWLFALGSPHQIGGDAAYCLRPGCIADRLTWGQNNTWEMGPDLAHTRLAACWGSNPMEAHPNSKGRELLRGLEKGARLLVVDPVFTKTANKADLWLQLRPATDAALALGITNIIIENELYDRDFVTKQTVGFDQLKKRAAEYPLGRVSEITWVPEEKIMEAARLLAKFRPAALYHRMGTNMNTNNVQNLRAVDCLFALLGGLDLPGGNLFHAPSARPRPVSFFSFQVGDEPVSWAPPKEICMERPGAREYPLNYDPTSPVSWKVDEHPHMALDYLLDGRIKAVLWSHDPVMGLQNSLKVVRAIKALELSVVMDLMITPTAEVSDYVLPIATWLEKERIHDQHYINFIGSARRVVEPRGEALDEREICGRLARALDLETFVELSSVEAYNNWRLKPVGISFEELKSKGLIGPWDLEYSKWEEKGFPTPSGKVELFSTLLEKHGYDPLPSHSTPADSLESEQAQDFPFIFISGGRNIEFLHSMQRSLSYTRGLINDPLVTMHPDTASGLELEEGDWVWISTPFSEANSIPPVRQRVRLSKTMHPRIVHAMSHWYYPEGEGGASRGLEFNINTVITDQPPYDPITGSPMIRGGLCRIRKMEKGESWPCTV
jgi:anaerobic selenocysteine-containing dehydrogenase